VAEHVGLELRNVVAKFPEHQAAADRTGIAHRIPAVPETNCMAEHVGLELRNVVAKYPFERSQ
jgi:hypothetical protein